MIMHKTDDETSYTETDEDEYESSNYLEEQTDVEHAAAQGYVVEGPKFRNSNKVRMYPTMFQFPKATLSSLKFDESEKDSKYRQMDTNATNDQTEASDDLDAVILYVNYNARDISGPKEYYSSDTDEEIEGYIASCSKKEGSECTLTTHHKGVYCNACKEPSDPNLQGFGRADVMMEILTEEEKKMLGGIPRSTNLQYRTPEDENAKYFSPEEMHYRSRGTTVLKRGNHSTTESVEDKNLLYEDLAAAGDFVGNTAGLHPALKSECRIYKSHDCDAPVQRLNRSEVYELALPTFTTTHDNENESRSSLASSNSDYDERSDEDFPEYCGLHRENAEGPKSTLDILEEGGFSTLQLELIAGVIPGSIRIRRTKSEGSLGNKAKIAEKVVFTYTSIDSFFKRCSSEALDDFELRGFRHRMEEEEYDSSSSSNVSFHTFYKKQDVPKVANNFRKSSRRSETYSVVSSNEDNSIDIGDPLQSSRSPSPADDNGLSSDGTNSPKTSNCEGPRPSASSFHPREQHLPHSDSGTEESDFEGFNNKMTFQFPLEEEETDAEVIKLPFFLPTGYMPFENPLMAFAALEQAQELLVNGTCSCHDNGESEIGDLHYTRSNNCNFDVYPSYYSDLDEIGPSFCVDITNQSDFGVNEEMKTEERTKETRSVSVQIRSGNSSYVRRMKAALEKFTSYFNMCTCCNRRVKKAKPINVNNNYY